MFIELREDNMFKKVYFDLLKYQLTRGSLQLEGINPEAITMEQSMKVYDQLSAINYMFNEKIDYSHMGFINILCDIVNLVSGGEISNFRTTAASVNGSNVERSKASMIRNDLWHLIDDYNYMLDNARTDKELFEVESYFHIRFLHIHPFEDANGRTARILLTYNLSKQNLAPAIITMDRKKDYCDYIENSNYKGLSNLFEELSKEELELMVTIYRDLDKRGLIKENKLSVAQEKELKKIRCKKNI